MQREMTPVGMTGTHQEGKSMATQAALATVVQTESARLQHYLTTLPADAWTQPSACALWDIRDVVAHLSGIAHGYTDRITRGLRGDTSPSPAGFPAPHLFTTLSGEERRQRATAFAQGPSRSARVLATTWCPCLGTPGTNSIIVLSPSPRTSGTNPAIIRAA